MVKKALGQNFLFDPSILRRIVEGSGVGPEDTVVEIGPGPGALTKLLLERAKKVVAIELDRGLFERLREAMGHDERLELHLGDALRFDYSGLGPFKVVANIPYRITTPIIFRLLGAAGLRSMTLTVQKEVARRIAAGPGSKDYGVLSLMIQYKGKPSYLFTIPAGAFRPVPKVDSACVRIDIYDTPPVIVKDEELFRRLIKAAFSQRRKTIVNGIRAVADEPAEALRRAGIDGKRRPETLALEEFARLCDAVSDPGGK